MEGVELEKEGEAKEEEEVVEEEFEGDNVEAQAVELVEDGEEVASESSELGATDGQA